MKTHCDLCLSPIAQARAVRHLDGEALEFCCPGCATVFELLGPEEARRMGPRFKGGGEDEAELPPGPYLELWLKVDGLACAACAPAYEAIPAKAAPILTKTGGRCLFAHFFINILKYYFDGLC